MPRIKYQANLESRRPILPHCVVESLRVVKSGWVGVVAIVLGTVGEVAGGVTLEVIIVGHGRPDCDWVAESVEEVAVTTVVLKCFKFVWIYKLKTSVKLPNL